MSSEPIRINIIVEGQTEETFARDVLGDKLAHSGVYVYPRCVETSRVRERSIRLGQKKFKIYRGGITNYEKARKDIRRWLREDKTAFLTTMFDLYALPEDFPNYDKAKLIRNPYEKVTTIERGIAEDINNSHFIPYIQLHEFEGLLFSDVQMIDDTLKVYQGSGSKIAELKKVRGQFKTPEEINDGFLTAPSKRITNIFNFYEKVTLGVLIAQSIGVEAIMNECPHFRGWISSLLELAKDREIKE